MYVSAHYEITDQLLRGTLQCTMTLEPVRRLNLDKYTRSTDDTWVNVNKLVVQGSKGTVVVGPENSGKTTEVMSMLLQQNEDGRNRYIQYDQLWIWAMDIEESKYKLARQLMIKRGMSTEMDEATGELPDFILSDDFSSIPSVTEIDKHKQTVIIFDDVVMESKKIQKPIVDFYKGARKRNCQLYYLSQGFFEVPKMIRRNTTYFWIYRLRDPREFSALATTFELYMPREMFRKVYLKATEKTTKVTEDGKKEEVPSFLFVNVNMRYVPYRFRRDFEKVLCHVPMK